MPRARLPQDWPSLPDDELLDVRMCDLPVAIEGRSPIASRNCAMRWRPRAYPAPIHFYLADEWFTPDGATAIAIPFYLAHPRLEKLEESQMFEVEGGEHEWSMRILRHEAGHAIDNAYQLRRRRQRREVFGSPAAPYPEFYTPKAVQQELRAAPRFVVRAEPSRRGLRRDVRRVADAEQRMAAAVRGWPALRKLEYMDG
jgi:hypothetical protein